MKEKKENQMPAAMLSNQEPVKKLTKLVLPEPQISDQVLHPTSPLNYKSLDSDL